MRRLCALLLAAPAAVACVGDPPGPSAAQRAELASHVRADVPADATRVSVDYDGKIELVGWAVSPKLAVYPPGTDVTVSLFWRPSAKLEGGWRLFTHLVARGGRTLANLDDAGPLRRMAGVTGPPLAPSRWEPGKVYEDSLAFRVPADPSPSVTVAAGLYDGDKRLAIRGPGGDRQSRSSVVVLETGAPDARTVVPELSVRKLASGASPTIDGKLDEEVWSDAASTGPFVDVGSGKENASSPIQGAAKLLWDEHFVYVGFEVVDATLRGGHAPDAIDPHLWENDTVEIMLDPDGDGDNRDYYEIQVNPQNLVFDTQYDAYNAPNGGGRGPFGHEEWSAGLTSAVALRGSLDDDSDRDQGYTVEAKIPWKAFSKAKESPPKVGSTWRMNLYAMQDNGGVAWSPILGQGNFHRASRFGRVRWVEP